MAYPTLKYVLMILGSFCVAATLLPFVRTGTWWIRIFDFPRLQLTIVSALTLVVFLHFATLRAGLDVAVILALVVCMLYQVTKIYPYTPLAPVKA